MGTDGNWVVKEWYWGDNKGGNGMVTEGVRTQLEVGNYLEVRNQRGRKTNGRGGRGGGGGGGVRGGRRGKEVEEKKRKRKEEVEEVEDEEEEEVEEVKEVKEVEEEVEEEEEEVEVVEEVEKVEAEVVLEKANFQCNTGKSRFPSVALEFPNKWKKAITRTAPWSRSKTV